MELEQAWKSSLVLELSVASLRVRLSALSFSFDKTKDAKYYYRHRHTAYEVHYVTAGSCVIRVGTQDHRLSAGEMCVIEPDLFHSQRSYQEPFDKVCFSFELIGGPEDRKNKDAAAIDHAMRSVHMQILPGDAIRGVLGQMKALADSFGEKIAGYTKMTVLCELLILELAQAISTENERSVLPLTNMDIRRSSMIDEFFNDNFNLNDGDARLAEKLCVSRRQLDRILKKLYGMSFREKLLQMRLEVATDFLLTSEKSIAEISELLGYSCPANFSTFVKSGTGKTPSDLKREGRGLCGGGAETRGF